MEAKWGARAPRSPSGGGAEAVQAGGGAAAWPRRCRPLLLGVAVGKQGLRLELTLSATALRGDS